MAQQAAKNRLVCQRGELVFIGMVDVDKTKAPPTCVDEAFEGWLQLL